VDVEGVERGRTDDFGRRVDGEGGEGETSGRGKGAEVSVAEHVPSPDGAIKGGCEEDVASFGILGCSHSRAVFSKGSNVKAGIDIPDFDVAIARACNDPIRFR